MKVRSLCPLAAALGLWVGGTTVAADSAKTVSTKSAVAKATATSEPVENQKLAESIAARLTSTNSADGSDVTLTTEAGVVTVSGSVRDAAQKKAILQDIRVVPGVKMVRDGITIGSQIRQVNLEAQPPGTGLPLPMGPIAPMPPVGIPPTGAGPSIEPMPLGHPGMGPGDGYAPPLPPHAWPTYAPYNNVSRVAYPQAYPHNAFPFIGPFYPFPKVPLGWRSVQLDWEDGHWWLGRKSVPHDYWRVRFW